MSDKPYLSALCCAFCFFLLTVLPSSAQSNLGFVSGYVEDVQEARIQGAHIKLLSSLTGAESRTESNEVGAFQFSGVLPGTYVLQIERDGFAAIQVRDLSLGVGETKGLLVRMRVGPSTEFVTVNDDQVVVGTTADSLGSTLGHQLIENVPVEGRSLQQMILLTPGVVGQNPQALDRNPGTEGDLSVNGQSTQANWYVVDGLSGNFGATYPSRMEQTPPSGAIPAITALGTSSSLAQLDSIDAVRVNSLAYAAEYGRTPGGQFSVFTKSGTMQMHGSLYEYFRHSSLDANDWFANNLNLPRQNARQSDFGGTAGGPIPWATLFQGQRRGFYFFSYEGIRAQNANAPALQYVPSLAVRSSAVEPMRQLLNAFPLPTGAEIVEPETKSLTGLAPFVRDSSLPSSLDSIGSRVDIQFSPKNSFFFRNSYTPSYRDSRQLSSVSRAQIDTQTYSFGITNQLSGNIVNQLRFGFSKSEASLLTRLDNFAGAQMSDLNSVFGGPDRGSGVASTLYIRMNGIGESKLEQGLSSNASRQLELSDTLLSSWKNHRFKAGVDFRRLTTPIVPPALSVEHDFDSRDRLLIGVTSESLISRSLAAAPLLRENSAYFQDDWNLLRSLFFSYGFRWEITPAPGEVHGRRPYFVGGESGVGNKRPLWTTDWFKNFAPRAGVSWRIHEDCRHSTSLRVGSGIFWQSMQPFAAEAFRGLGFRSTNYLKGMSLPVSVAPFIPAIDPEKQIGQTQLLVMQSYSDSMPYIIDYSLGLQEGFGKHQVLDLSYVGGIGSVLVVPAFYGPIGGFQGIASGSNNSSMYNSLQLKYQGDYRNGLHLFMTYNYADSRDQGVIFNSRTSGSPFVVTPSFAQSWIGGGRSDLSIRHALQGALSWELFHSPDEHSFRSIWRNWSVDSRVAARSGFPIRPTGALFTIEPTGQKVAGPVGVNYSRPLVIHGDQYPGKRILNGGPSSLSPAFVAAPVDNSVAFWRKYNVVPRSRLESFGTFQINMALRKEFFLSDRIKVQFRTEIFNVTNHPNFGYVDTNLTDAQFGRATKMLNQSSGTTSPLYEQGGPRAFQFMLRLHY